MIDHKRHSHLMSYSMAKGTVSNITGAPKNVFYIYFSIENGKLAVECDEGDNYHIYRISGNNVVISAEIPLETFDPADISSDPKSYFETDNGGKFKTDYHTLAIWTGSEYKDLGLNDVYNVVTAGSKLYVLTYEQPEYSEEGYAPGEEPISTVDVNGTPFALYEISFDGLVTKLYQGLDKSEVGDIIESELIDNWFFSFWVEDDGGTACGLFFKQKVG